MEAVHTQLNRHGYVVIPLISKKDLYVLGARNAIRQVIAESSQTFKLEVLRQSLATGYDNPRLVSGDFSALTHAESFHHPWVRTLRWRAHNLVFPILKHLPPNPNLGENPMYGMRPPAYVAQVFDRLMTRPVGAKAIGEHWHRDFSPQAQKYDRVFGGWINLNLDENQYFSCVPGTAVSEEMVKGNKGFQQIPKEEWPQYRARAQRVTIPPGHILVFDQTTVHEVLKSQQKRVPQVRLFTGFIRNLVKADNNTHPLIQENLKAMRLQSVPPVKSGQVAPYYPRLYNSYHKLQAKRDAMFGNLTPAAKAAGDALNNWPQRKWPYVLPPLTSPGMRPFEDYSVRDQQVLLFN